MPRRFYERETVTVARELLGMTLIHGGRAGRIVEAEAYPGAYLGQPDLAAHSSKGVTPRTRVIFGPPGRAYVYLIYGMYECLNLVTERDGSPGCVLIRALQPLEAGGLPMNGPGKLTRAMGIARAAHNGADVTGRGPLRVAGPAIAEAFEIEATPRIGIRHCSEWPLRFCIRGSAFVSAGTRRKKF